MNEEVPDTLTPEQVIVPAPETVHVLVPLPWHVPVTARFEPEFTLSVAPVKVT